MPAKSASNQSKVELATSPMPALSESHYDIVIVGAGPCGLGAAWEVEQRRSAGNPMTYLLVNAGSAIGGSAASVTTPEGFIFDYGGHILYPHEEYGEFITLLNNMVDEWHESKPVRGVWIDNRLIPYPVQRNIHRLPTHKLLSCLKGLGQVSLKRRFGGRRHHGAENLEGYLRSRFGSGLTKHVLGPLNRKMWAHDPLHLGTSWTRYRSGSRVANVADASVRQILRSIITRRDNLGWNDATRVRYPLQGGMGAIWTNIARQLHPEAVANNVRVTEVDAEARWVLLSDGRRIHYNSLISSVPLDQLLDLLLQNPVPDLTGKFHYSNVVFIGLGIRGQAPPYLDGVHSFHLPEADIPCWRVSFPKSLSPSNVPPGLHWSILCEVSLANNTMFEIAELETQIVDQLGQRGILPSGSEIVSTWHSQLQHGYPLPFIGRDEMLQKAQGALKALNIFSRGRFGGWKYEVSNQDHSFMQGVEAVRMIVDGVVETTYRV